MRFGSSFMKMHLVRLPFQGPMLDIDTNGPYVRRQFIASSGKKRNASDGKKRSYAEILENRG